MLISLKIFTINMRMSDSKQNNTYTPTPTPKPTPKPTLTYSLQESNEIIKELLLDNTKPFFIARLSDIETKVSLQISHNIPLLPIQVQTVQNNAGIYISEMQDLTLYSRVYNMAVKSATHLACFPTLYTTEQNYWLKDKSLPKGLHSRVLEPFYLIEENIEPWSRLLEGKRILVVSPFVVSFAKQVETNFQFYNTDDPSKQIFAPSQAFVFYKAYNTQAGNHLHKNWFETFSKMCKELKDLNDKTPFDIALLSCGGYGLPLAHYILKNLKKSAIYVGGGLQLLFGVNGKRWTNHPVISRVSQLPNNKWIKPSDDEIPKNSRSIEGGCYW